MINPWLSLPEHDRHLLPEDAPFVKTFNASTKNTDHVIHTDLLPEPWVGALDAPIVLLALNPGFSDHDAESQADAGNRARLLANLRGGVEKCPFYHLHPDSHGSGAEWWRRSLGALITDFSAETVAASILCIEYFPYHSRSFGHAALRLPSQAFSFDLARKAVQRNALVLVTRGFPLWWGAVPELASYPRCFQSSNTRRVSISEGCYKKAFPEIASILSQSRSTT